MNHQNASQIPGLIFLFSQRVSASVSASHPHSTFVHWSPVPVCGAPVRLGRLDFEFHAVHVVARPACQQLYEKHETFRIHTKINEELLQGEFVCEAEVKPAAEVRLRQTRLTCFALTFSSLPRFAVFLERFAQSTALEEFAEKKQYCWFQTSGIV